MLDNMSIYKRTLTFSIHRLLWDLGSILLLAILCGAGFIIADKTAGKGLIGLAIGAALGIIIAIILTRFVSYRYKAGQIAMMTRGITEGELPEDVLGEGKQIVRERFVTVAAFFAATGLIRGIFNQIGRGITKVGEKVGGRSGGTVGSIVSSLIQVIVAYLCDCCLGWVFYRKEVGAMKATCEGAVLFFKHGKTFFRNMGRIFGIGLATLIAVGGFFGGIAYLIMSRFPEAFRSLSLIFGNASTEADSAVSQWLSDPARLMIICAALVGIIFWAMIHSVFIKPFVLVGVLRNYINSGVNDIPTEDSFNLLDSKSKKFRKAHAQI